MRRTLVAFHAHPDDEALLTAGTMAWAAAEGHRVLLGREWFIDPDHQGPLSRDIFAGLP